MNKITIIGSGSVGSTVAYTLTVCGIASEIVIIDINNEKAIGEALDIRQGVSFCNPCQVYAGSYQDAADSDIVIVTSGLPRKAGQSRLELTQTNLDVLRSITPDITRYAPNAVYLFVSNPVDILTYAFTKWTGIPENRIIGSGTVLDTARLHARLSEYYKISQKNVHAYVLGEHGDSSFIPWSLANISAVPIHECHKSFGDKDNVLSEINYAEVEEYVKKSGGMIIERKGATFYAVSVSVAHICKCLFSRTDSTMTISTMMHGEYGVDDVCLSTLNTVGNMRVRGKVMLPLNDDEIRKLHQSAEKLKTIIKTINI